MKKLSTGEEDALRDAASIGATKALSSLIKKKIKLKISTTNIVSVNELPRLIRGSKTLIVGIYSSISGYVFGNIMIIFPKESALLITDLLQNRTTRSKHISKKDESSLKKMFNKTSMAYLNALSNFLAIKLKHTKPKIISTFGESTTDFLLLNITEEKHVLLFKTDFYVPSTKIKGNIILVLTIKSIENLLGKIKDKIGK